MSRKLAYKYARIAGDVNAVRRGRIWQRLFNKLIGRLIGRSRVWR